VRAVGVSGGGFASPVGAVGRLLSMKQLRALRGTATVSRKPAEEGGYCPQEIHGLFHLSNLVEGASSEDRFCVVLGSSALLWCSDVFCAMAHIYWPETGVWCLRYVARLRRHVKAQDRYLFSF
jgi:hypothetical protein